LMNRYSGYVRFWMLDIANVVQYCCRTLASTQAPLRR
jgi:hypothetical protein